MKSNQHFYVIKNQNEDTYRIECRLVVYRAKLKQHPDFLHPTGDAKDGFYTKYYLLIKDDISSEQAADDSCDKLETDYRTIIETAEDTGDWSRFPFKNCQIVYYK